jgi:2-polyprenyl-3-methyl-5-hydroxy-6-metoxy-1,4-benzoquinol methylase
MSDDEFTGKYEKSGLIGRELVNRFFQAVRSLLEPRLRPDDRILEVGCGAGYSTQRLAEWITGTTFVGADLGFELVKAAAERNPGASLLQESVYSLAHPANAFDVVIMMEVLEHLEDPDRALAELKRVAGRLVLVSTPREPVWRLLNMARGKYWSDFGNTPGHIQHWSTAGLVRQVCKEFDVIASATPLPWSILLLRPR